MKTLKRLVSKTTQTGNLETDAFYKGLLELRNTPREEGVSPAQILFGRSVRGIVPMHTTSYAGNQDWRKQKEAVKCKQIRQYNKTAKALPQLMPGQKVLLQDPV